MATQTETGSSGGEKICELAKRVDRRLRIMVEEKARALMMRPPYSPSVFCLRRTIIRHVAFRSFSIDPCHWSTLLRHLPPATDAFDLRDASNQIPGQSIRVGLVEDEADVREALARHIADQSDLALIWTAASCKEALAHLSADGPDVLLVDLGLPDGSGLQVIRAARTLWPDCNVLVSTIFGDEAHVLPSIEAGATGYLLKDSSAPGIAQEIRSVHAGGSPISPMVARKILARAVVSSASVHGLPSSPAHRSHSPHTPSEDQIDPFEPQTVALSAREREVLQLVSKGFTTEETASALDISSSTARTFVRRIYAKLQVRTRAAAIDVAHRHGLLKD